MAAAGFMLPLLLLSLEAAPTAEVCPRSPQTAEQKQGAAFVSGWGRPVPTPSPSAVRLNQEAAQLYKQRRYDEAARLYRAADAEDPSFLAPRLNLVGLLVRQDKWDDAEALLRGLLRDGFVPWHQQAREATDLAALWARRGETLAAAVVSSASAWGAEVARGAVFVVRLRPPVRLAPEDGPSALFPQQELVAWNPATGRFHQVTSTQGRVLALVHPRPGQPLVFITAEKIRRRSGRLSHFEGMRVHQLDLTTMTADIVPVEGPVARAELTLDEQGQVHLAVGQPGQRIDAGLRFRLMDRRWLSSDSRPRVGRAGRVTLTVAGVAPTKMVAPSTACGWRASDDFSGKQAVVRIRPRRGSSFVLPAPHGIGLQGLPLADLDRGITP